MYVLGGYNNDKKAMDSMERFNFSQKTWIQCAPLPVALHSAAAVLVGLCIYVFGGLDAKSVPVSTVFSYNIVTDRWVHVSTMPFARAKHAAVVHGRFVYVIGGERVDFSTTKSVEKMNLDTQEWNQCAPMDESRAAFACVTFQNLIYVFGGYEKAPGSRVYYTLRTVERYEPEADVWRGMQDLPDCTVSCGAAVFDGNIHIFGGVRWEEDSKERYNEDLFEYKIYCNVASIDEDDYSYVERKSFACTSVNGEIFVIGGENKLGHANSRVTTIPEGLEMPPLLLARSACCAV